jgi:hypothetical protein
MGLNQTKLLLNKGNNEQNKDTTFWMEKIFTNY